MKIIPTYSKTVCFTVFSFCLLFSPCVAAEPDWYRDSYIHSHVSLNLPVEHIDFIKKQIEIVKPDAIQFHTHNLALLKHIKSHNINEKLHFKVVATINYAGTWYSPYDDNDKYIYRIHSDGTFAGRWSRKHLCLNAPVVDDVIIPEKYVQIPKITQPDQVWIDESIITINVCYCPNCIEKYKTRYGKEPPKQLTEDNFEEWEQWIRFHRDSFVEWMRKVVDAVHSVDPDILVTINHAYFVEQPEKLPDFIKNLSGDIHKDPLELGLYAKYAASINAPFDLMPGLGSDIWAGIRPKTIEQIYNDISIITAYGGRWNIGEFPTDFLSLRKEEKYQGPGYRRADMYLDFAEKGADFARERKPYCMNTRPVPYAAILHSARTHYAHVIFNTNNINDEADYGMTSDGILSRNDVGRINSRIYWPNNKPIADDLIGAYEALLENHVQFDLVHAEYLRENINKYKLLILAEQTFLEDETIDVIKDFVRHGGTVIASGTTVKAGLDDVLGVRVKPASGAKGVTIQTGTEKISLSSYMPISLSTANVIQQASDSAHPVITRNRFGKGTAVYIAGNIFEEYFRRSGYSYKPKGHNEPIRLFMKNLIESARATDPNPITISAQPWYEVFLMEDVAYLYVHIINRRINWKQSAETDTPIDLSLPFKSKPVWVKLQPGNNVLNFIHHDQKIELTIEPDDIDYHKIVQIKK